jgi:hypothetical protein
VSYSDPDGDVTPSGTRVFLSSRDDSGFQGDLIEIPGNELNVSGDGSTGVIVVEFCILFRAANWIAMSMVVWDAAENASDPIETITVRPPGAD